MKINEAVDIINKTKTVYAYYYHSDIFVCFKWASSDKYFLLMPDDTKAWDGVTLISSAIDDVSPEDLARVMGVVQRLIDTPVKERFLEKKWLLCLGKNDYGQKIYLAKVNGPITTLNEDCLTEWDNKEIQDLIRCFPNLAPAINDMKEEVDNNEN